MKTLRQSAQKVLGTTGGALGEVWRRFGRGSGALFAFVSGYEMFEKASLHQDGGCSFFGEGIGRA